MPIYYTKIPQNEELNQTKKESKSKSYSELKDFDSASACSILSIDRVYLQENAELERIETRYGPVVVGKQSFNGKQNIANNSGSISSKNSNNTNGNNGNSNGAIKSKKDQKGVKLNPIILTIHDVGLNHDSNYTQFFNSLDAKILLNNFTIFHINLPGQHSSCSQLNSAFVYPTMDQMSEIVDFVVSYYDIENFIGFGQGLGGNLLIRYAIKKPSKVNGLFLINPTYYQASWVEWIYQKRNIKHLQIDKNLPDKSLLLSPIVQDYLIWSQFGKASIERDLESLRIIEEYRCYFKSRFIDSFNLSLLIDSYVKRKFINLTRDGLKGSNKLQCDCIVLAGSLTSTRNESNQLYTRLSPEKSNFIQLSNCGNPLLEKPIKVLEIFKLFLLGNHYLSSNLSNLSNIKKSVSSYLNSTSSNSTNSANVFNESNSCLIDFFTPN